MSSPTSLVPRNELTEVRICTGWILRCFHSWFKISVLSKIFWRLELNILFKKKWRRGEKKLFIVRQFVTPLMKVKIAWFLKSTRDIPSKAYDFTLKGGFPHSNNTKTQHLLFYWEWKGIRNHFCPLLTVYISSLITKTSGTQYHETPLYAWILGLLMQYTKLYWKDGGCQVGKIRLKTYHFTMCMVQFLC